MKEKEKKTEKEEKKFKQRKRFLKSRLKVAEVEIKNNAMIDNTYDDEEEEKVHGDNDDDDDDDAVDNEASLQLPSRA